MIRVSCVISMLILMLAGCSRDVQTGIPGAEKGNARDLSVVIMPERATIQTVISLKADHSLVSEGDVRWYVNDIRDESQKGTRFIPVRLRKGDYIKAVIFKNRKKFRSNTIILKNTQPVMGTSNILPDRPKINSVLTARVSATDADNDFISFIYRWAINGVFAGEESYLEAEFKRGDVITLEVTPFDRTESGKGVRLSTTIVNSLPVVSESDPSFDGKLYKYQVTATDPDQDMLKYKLLKGPDGMNVDPGGLVTWEVRPEDKGTHDVEVSITDDQGGEVVMPFTTSISFPVES